MRKLFITILGVIFICGALYINITHPGSTARIGLKEIYQTFSAKNKNTVQIGKREFFVEVVKTPEEKAKGLAGHEPLMENQGMLFVFKGSESTSFWMKGMTFPIDIIWIKDNKVIYTVENAPPPPSPDLITDLPVYSPPEPAEYVLETKAGMVGKAGIKNGDDVNLKF